MPNAIAYLVLFAWPLIANRICKRASLVDAAILLFLLPYLFLPVKTGIDLPLLPMVDKESLPAIVALILLRKPLSESKEQKMPTILKLCFIAMLGGIFITTLLNSDGLVFEERVVPGMKIWDYVGLVFGQIFSILVPFYIGFKLLHSDFAHQRVVFWFAIMGLAYLVPMLWEVRMSPQLHSQIYGFFPHDFRQQMREGGFRPVVFLGHGLLVAFFSFSACICAFAWMKENDKLWKFPSKVVLLGLVLGLVLCKTLGSMIYLVASAALLIFLSAKLRYLFLLLLMLLVMIYPAIRSAATDPLNDFVAYVEQYKPDRAQSLSFRLQNEENLLEKAQEKPWFGWGGWARNQIFNKQGWMISVTDGVWIIIFGVSGWVGYLGFMGLLVVPIWNIYKLHGSRKEFEKINICTSTLSVVLVCNTIDFIPNSSLSHITLLLAGALSGWALSKRQSVIAS